MVTRMCGGLLDHRRPLCGRSIAGADGRSDPGCLEPTLLGQAADFAPGLGQIQMDVGTQCLERRDVDDPDLVGKRALEPLAEQLIERVQESRQGLCPSRWALRSERLGRPNGFPAEALGRGGFAKTVLETSGRQSDGTRTAASEKYIRNGSVTRTVRLASRLR